MSTPCHIIRANLNEHTHFFLFESRIFFFQSGTIKAYNSTYYKCFIKLSLFLLKKYLNY